MHPCSGRHFLQIPGPTNVPERVLRAMARPMIDHRGPEFGRLGLQLLEGIKEIFQTRGHVTIFPSSGGEVNTVPPGARRHQRTEPGRCRHPRCRLLNCPI